MEKRVLIVDDDASVQQSFIDYFEDRLWEVFTAQSAEEAISQLSSLGSLVVIVDVRLPGMNGDEFVRKANQINKGLRFAICSGSPNYTVPDDILALSCVSDQVFSKPLLDIQLIENELIRLGSIKT